MHHLEQRLAHFLLGDRAVALVLFDHHENLQVACRASTRERPGRRVVDRHDQNEGRKNISGRAAEIFPSHGCSPPPMRRVERELPNATTFALRSAVPLQMPDPLPDIWVHSGHENSYGKSATRIAVAIEERPLAQKTPVQPRLSRRLRRKRGILSSWDFSMVDAANDPVHTHAQSSNQQ